MVTIPARGRFGAWTAVLVCGLAITVQLAIHDRAFVELDEGHLLAASERVRNGELLYRDVHTGVFPGIYWMEAALFAVFGPDLIWTRRAQVVVNAATALCLWLIGRRIVGRPWVAVPVLGYGALVFLGFPSFTMFNYSTTALAAALATLLATLRYLEHGRTRDGLLTGLALAICALTKQNVGAFTALACLATVLATRRRSLLAGRSAAAVLWPVCVGGGIPTLAVVGWFAATGTLDDWVRATTVAAVASQLQSYRVGFPPIVGTSRAAETAFDFLYAPPALYAYMVRGGRVFGMPIPLQVVIRVSYALPLLVLVLTPMVLASARRAADARWRATWAVVFWAAFELLAVFPFAIWPHLAFAAVPAFLPAAVLGERLLRGRVGWVAVGVVASATLALMLGLSLFVRDWFDVPMGVPAASLRVSPAVADRHRAAVAFLRDCASESEPIFTAPILPQLYVFAGRRNATPHDLLIPGSFAGADVIRALVASRPPCVMYAPRTLPGMPRLRQSFPDVARYLRRHYRRVLVLTGEGSTWYGLVRREDRHAE